jgi:hypothetical protein
VLNVLAAGAPAEIMELSDAPVGVCGLHG